MQASIVNEISVDSQPSNQPMNHCPAPDESNNSFIPYCLDKQQEDNLSIDIIQLYQKLLPSKESYEKRTKFVKKMEKLLNSEWPDHDIKPNVFGSSVNNLGTTSSDIDLCITTPWNGLRNVKVLAKLFRRCGMQHIVCVPRAKVPIVRLFDPEMQLSCDINVNNTVALENTKMIKVYVSLDPRVRPLIMIVKHWTKQRLLNDAANGGTLSSYTWTCMIINFLQQREPPILPVLHEADNEAVDEYYFCDDVKKWEGFGLKNKESLGGLLYAFFRRFSLEFDYDNQVVSVRQGKYLTKKEKGWDTGRNKASLCVEEPFNPSRNLGNSADVSSVLGLRCEFQRCLDLLLDQADLETIFSIYKPYTDYSADIPVNNFFSLTLPTSINSKTEDTAHPYDRRKSMVDGIYQYYSPQEHPIPHSPPIAHPSFTFHPRFSSSQVLDTIIQGRNTRHGSHPLSPVPSTLLSMLNISTSQHRSIDSLFARYQKKPKQQEENDEHPKPRKKGNYFRRKPFEQQDRKSRRRSSGTEWPSISNHIQNGMQPLDEVMIPSSPRRWSTVKRHEEEEKKKTLAEIIKVAQPSFSPSSQHASKKQTVSKPSTSTTTNTSSNNSKSRQKKSSKNNSKNSNSNHNNSNHRQQKNKSNHKLRA
ncbi:hypothetical protein G6F46_009486 [Rhizopus delemar]|uniref:polynucleotide adenylyltransferase n=2 Tax=Rhizopus TaxID=4842 RepID=A0A9P7CTQ5_9FUNG|nr:hypothetical protein G6F55_008293 [Rhizopus delemar]KAG1553563.1 hypothetical protein G6F51_000527 [Rhizopus arrhizus]KAG1521247.1 hypothetical protein G6F52_006918 [Rhizopus delemar]KAG1561513.1 hypothetical protein G6F49_001734 [Rhizopus delemar]KAG1575748.1 hypothetical protein G6F50_000804 [Rhizopus delemar]